VSARAAGTRDPWKPYSPPCVERENVFEFTQKPAVKLVAKDRYEITFGVKGNCDAAVGIVDEKGVVVRHLACGVLGPNAPEPFQKNTLSQKIYWNGKDDLDVYPKDVSKLKVRVMLGLKPVFHKRLGGTSPKNLPGGVWGLALDRSGAYVFIRGGWGLMSIRKFDRDGNYLRMLYPPPASAPLENYSGTRFIEYEPGKRAWHGADSHQSIINGIVTPPLGKSIFCQMAIAGKKLLFLNSGRPQFNAGSWPPSKIHWLNTDGTTEPGGLKGTPFAWLSHRKALMAVSPDEKWVYAVGGAPGDQLGPVVVRAPADGSGGASLFIGEKGKPGSDNRHLNTPTGLDCDAKGRVYVSDMNNNRVQIFSPEGKHLKTIPLDRPQLLRVHGKTGAIYVQHSARRQGKTFARLTKFAGFDTPKEEFHVDSMASTSMALDSWSAKARLWVTGEAKSFEPYSRRVKSRHGVRVYEEDGKGFRLICDFDAEARKEAGENYLGRWSGSVYDKVMCDPVREHLYFKKSYIFDLPTGKLVGVLRLPGATDDIAFDKYGYMHGHFNPCFFMQGVGRFDPARASRSGDKNRPVLSYPECPYDYGIEKGRFAGILPVKDQNGAKGFQDGLGVNMRGDIVVESNIYHVPRMEEEGWNFAARAIVASRQAGDYVDGSRGRAYNNFAAYSKMIQNKEKRGEEIYFVRRVPGVALAGATVWTYERSGELRRECAGTVGELIAGVQMDEDGCLYFTNNRLRAYQGRQFLAGRGGVVGSPKAKFNPYVSTLMKTAGHTKVLKAKSTIPLEPIPERPADLLDHGIWPIAGDGSGGTRCWVDAAEWLYAGAGSMVGQVCSCPSSRFCLDWYKRVFTPEAYRRSLAALDTNGNLIMHIGRYGNFDDAAGGRNGCKPGGTDIGVMLSRFIAASDNYMVFDDWGERLVVMKLDYEEEATVPLSRP
jgi:hypothetical protein